MQWKSALRRRWKRVPALIYSSSTNFPIWIPNSSTKWKMKQTMQLSPSLSKSLSCFCFSSASSWETDIKLLKYLQARRIMSLFLSSKNDQVPVPTRHPYVPLHLLKGLWFTFDSDSAWFWKFPLRLLGLFSRRIPIPPHFSGISATSAPLPLPYKKPKSQNLI